MLQDFDAEKKTVEFTIDQTIQTSCLCVYAFVFE